MARSFFFIIIIIIICSNIIVSFNRKKKFKFLIFYVKSFNLHKYTLKYFYFIFVEHVMTIVEMLFQLFIYKIKTA